MKVIREGCAGQCSRAGIPSFCRMAVPRGQQMGDCQTSGGLKGIVAIASLLATAASMPLARLSAYQGTAHSSGFGFVRSGVSWPNRCDLACASFLSHQPASEGSGFWRLRHVTAVSKVSSGANVVLLPMSGAAGKPRFDCALKWILAPPELKLGFLGNKTYEP